jgi:hypothetical protein
MKQFPKALSHIYKLDDTYFYVESGSEGLRINYVYNFPQNPIHNARLKAILNKEYGGYIPVPNRGSSEELFKFRVLPQIKVIYSRKPGRNHPYVEEIERLFTIDQCIQSSTKKRLVY